MSWYQQRQARTSAYLRDLSAGQKAVRLALAIVGVVMISIALGALFDDSIDWFSAVASAIGFGLVMAVILWRTSSAHHEWQ
jgi:F0F1-type ATP synthase assembly protein I